MSAPFLPRLPLANQIKQFNNDPSVNDYQIGKQVILQKPPQKRFFQQSPRSPTELSGFYSDPRTNYSIQNMSNTVGNHSQREVKVAPFQAQPPSPTKLQGYELSPTRQQQHPQILQGLIQSPRHSRLQPLSGHSPKKPGFMPQPQMFGTSQKPYPPQQIATKQNSSPIPVGPRYHLKQDYKPKFAKMKTSDLASSQTSFTEPTKEQVFLSKSATQSQNPTPTLKSASYMPNESNSSIYNYGQPSSESQSPQKVVSDPVKMRPSKIKFANSGKKNKTYGIQVHQPGQQVMDLPETRIKTPRKKNRLDSNLLNVPNDQQNYNRKVGNSLKMIKNADYNGGTGSNNNIHNNSSRNDLSDTKDSSIMEGITYKNHQKSPIDSQGVSQNSLDISTQQGSQGGGTQPSQQQILTFSSIQYQNVSNSSNSVRSVTSLSNIDSEMNAQKGSLAHQQLREAAFGGGQRIKAIIKNKSKQAVPEQPSSPNSIQIIDAEPHFTNDECSPLSRITQKNTLLNSRVGVKSVNQVNSFSDLPIEELKKKASSQKSITILDNSDETNSNKSPQRNKKKKLTSRSKKELNFEKRAQALSRLRSVAWAVVYPKLLINSVKSPLDQQQKLYNDKINETMRTAMNVANKIFAQKLYIPITSIFDDKHDYDFAGSKSDKKLTKQMYQYLDVSLLKLFNKIQDITQDLPDHFYEFLGSITIKNAILPVHYFTNYEFNRLKTSSTLQLKGVKQAHSKLIIAGFLYFRLIINNLILCSQSLFHVEATQKTILNVASILYNIGIQYLEELDYGSSVDSSKKNQLLLRTKQFSVRDHLSQIPNSQKNKKNDEFILGFQPIEANPELYQSEAIKRSKEFFGQWLDILYERSHSKIKLKKLMKKTTGF